MRYRVVAATAAVSFALGVVVTLLLSGGDPSRSAGPRAAEREGAGLPDPQVERVRGELRAKEEENAVLRAEVDELRLRIEEAQERARVAAKTKQIRSKEPRFVYSGTEAGLRAANWIEMGKATAALMPLMSEAREITEGKKPMRPELWGDIMREVGPIVAGAIAMDQAGVKWSHPSVAVNLVHSSLVEAGRPLSEAQEGTLDQLGTRYIQENDRRIGSYDKETLDLVRRIGDVHALDGLYAEVRGMLNGAQQEVLWPPGVDDIVGLDIFAGSTLWDERWWPLPYADRAGLRAATIRVLMEQLKLRPELLPVVTGVVTAWEAKLPKAYVEYTPSENRNKNKDFESSARILASAEHFANLFGVLRAQVPLNDEEDERIEQFDGTLVPHLTK